MFILPKVVSTATIGSRVIILDGFFNVTFDCLFQAVEDFHNQVGSVANLILDEFR